MRRTDQWSQVDNGRCNQYKYRQVGTVPRYDSDDVDTASAAWNSSVQSMAAGMHIGSRRRGPCILRRSYMDQDHNRLLQSRSSTLNHVRTAVLFLISLSAN